MSGWEVSQIIFFIVRQSFGHPNALNLDGDPGFWPNGDPDPDPGSLILIILEKKLKLVSVEKTPTVQTSFF